MKGLLIGILAIVFVASAAAQSLIVTNPRCEYRRDPVGIELSRPRLSWELQSPGYNVSQTAYHILVADDSSLLQKNTGNTWDSRKINSSASIQVEYKGKNLEASRQYFWKVKVWDNQGRSSGWSPIASWQMGLPAKQDWKGAKWICYEEIADSAIIAPHVHGNGKKAWGSRRNTLPMFRKEFSIAKKISKATAFISGLGHFEMSINGRKVGDHFLDPGWTNYAKQAQYVTFDITPQLQQCNNAIGVMLGNGFYYIPGQRYRKMTGAYGLPKMISTIIIEYDDGSTGSIISDETWKVSPSPIIFSSIFGGEDYDATREQAGWNNAGFNDNHWKSAVVTTGPRLLDAMDQEPVKIMQRFEPVLKIPIAGDTVVYDLGQNFSGIPIIKLRGNRGDTVRIYAAELLHDDSTANQKATGSPSFFTYILKGDGEENWQPRFSYTGFRYLQVVVIGKDSPNNLPVIEEIAGLHIRNAAESSGEFSCSNELFNKIHVLIDWAIKSNMVSVFTDCPHREKLGWLEQTHLMGSSVHYNYDIASLCRKAIEDMKNAQYENGMIPEIAPEFTKFTPPFDESPEWGSAAIILPWYNYQWYGDRRTLDASYPMMKAYAGYLENKANDNILSHGLGDWYDIGPNRPGLSQMTTMGITATAIYHYDLNILAKVANLLGKSQDEKKFRQLAESVKASFNKRFFDGQKLQYDSASQAANAMALYMNLVTSANKKHVVNALTRDIRSRGNALTAGDIGYRYVLKALEEAGLHQLIFEMNNRDDVPGYGYQLRHGATALTESWQAYPSVSNNHFMLGHLVEWFYGSLAGIGQECGSVAYKTILIKPEPVGDIRSARAKFHSPYGWITSEWKRTDTAFELQVSIPPNTRASVHLPATGNSVIKEKNNRPVKFKIKENKAIVELGSGNYHFTVQ